MVASLLNLRRTTRRANSHTALTEGCLSLPHHAGTSWRSTARGHRPRRRAGPDRADPQVGDCRHGGAHRRGGGARLCDRAGTLARGQSGHSRLVRAARALVDEGGSPRPGAAPPCRSELARPRRSVGGSPTRGAEQLLAGAVADRSLPGAVPERSVPERSVPGCADAAPSSSRPGDGAGFPARRRVGRLVIDRGR